MKIPVALKKMNILTKKQHWSGLFFRPCPDIQAIEISEKLSFPVF